MIVKYIDGSTLTLSDVMYYSIEGNLCIATIYSDDARIGDSHKYYINLAHIKYFGVEADDTTNSD